MNSFIRGPWKCPISVVNFWHLESSGDGETAPPRFNKYAGWVEWKNVPQQFPVSVRGSIEFLSSVIFPQVFHVTDVVFWINIYIYIHKFGWNKYRSFGNFSFKHGYVFFGGLGGGGKPSKMDGIFRWIFPWFPSLSGEVVCYFHQIHAVLTCWKWNKIGPLADCEWEFVQLNHGVWKRMEKGYVGTTPCPVTVTFFHWLFQLLFENPYKPSCVTVILGGGNQTYPGYVFHEPKNEMKLWI